MAEESGAQPRPLVIMAHSDGFDRLYQLGSIALTAAVSGRPVVVVLFFWALRAVVTGEMDEPHFSASDSRAAAEMAERVALVNNPPPSKLLAMARETGQVQLVACSASMQYLGLELECTAAAVDRVVGLATILRLASQGGELIYL